MADEATQVQTITNNVEALSQALQQAAANISGLLSLGTATCDEVRAYNLWAVATFDAQRGMLATIRAAGQTDVPELPPAPPLFVWAGVPGEAALTIDCSGQEQSLSGAMKKALKGPTAKSVFLDASQVQVTRKIPPPGQTFSKLAQQTGLGFPVVLVIVVAGISIAAISAAIVAISSYLKSSDIQENNSRQVALQAQAFANYTNARLQCQQRCVSGGTAHATCVDQCKQLIGKPDIKLPDNPFSQEWGLLQWTGFTVLLGGAGYIAYRVWEKKKAGRPIFEMPSFDHG